MVDNSKSVRKQVFDFISCFAAIITIIAYVILCINAQWPFLGDAPTVYNILVVIEQYAPLVVVALVGIEFVADKNIVLRIICYVAIALVVVCMFFPSTWSNFVGLIS